MGPTGGDVFDTTGCALLSRLGRVCHDGCGVERATNLRFLTRLTSTGIPCRRDVGGPGDLWSSAALSHVFIVFWIPYLCHSS